MRQSKFTETQIVIILKETDAGRPVNEIWRKYGISSATNYKWKAKSSTVGWIDQSSHRIVLKQHEGRRDRAIEHDARAAEIVRRRRVPTSRSRRRASSIIEAATGDEYKDRQSSKILFRNV